MFIFFFILSDFHLYSVKFSLRKSLFTQKKTRLSAMRCAALIS